MLANLVQHSTMAADETQTRGDHGAYDESIFISLRDLMREESQTNESRFSTIANDGSIESGEVLVMTRTDSRCMINFVNYCHNFYGSSVFKAIEKKWKILRNVIECVNEEPDDLINKRKNNDIMYVFVCIIHY